jgi:alpha-galactosidase
MEMSDEGKTTAAGFLRDATAGAPPFSFVYDGKPSAEFLAGWHVSHTGATSVAWRDPSSGLECLFEVTAFTDSPAVEWGLRFRNTGSSDTGILSEIRTLDLARPYPARMPVQVAFSQGTSGAIDDFALMQRELWPGRTPVKLASCGSKSYLPFFNLAMGDAGIIGGIGWSGNWQAAFGRDREGVLRVEAGLANAHFRLHPGEEVRTPRMLLIPWEGEMSDGHNLLRRHMATHHLPRRDGVVVEPPVCCTCWGGMKTHNHLALLETVRAHKLPFDLYWMDAGWYGPDHETEEFQNFYTEDWAYHRGDWRVNRAVHPDGLRPIAEAASKAGLDVLLWFSPYTAMAGMSVVEEHPDWINGRWSGSKGVGLNPKPLTVCRLDVGNPECRAFLVDQISAILAENGVKWFRDDSNLPIPKRAEVAPDRQGVAEIRVVQGFYQFWDELRRRNPGLMIDNCAGGGTRIDFETMSRSIVLWNTDYNCHPGADPIGAQVAAHGLAHWTPLAGGAPPVRPGDTYNFRSAWGGGIPFGLFHPCGFGNASTAPAADYPFDWHRRMIEDYRRVRKYFTGDFHPLTGCSTSDREWYAYQMHRPDLGEGVVVALRRPHSPFPQAHFPLAGLIDADYEVTDLDTGMKRLLPGAGLGGEGLEVAIGTKPGSVILTYKRVRGA